MLVCAHGNVDGFCKKKDMIVVDRYEGEIEDYDGLIRVLVTDTDMSKAEYYLLKGKLLARKVELISTKHKDSEDLAAYQVYTAQVKKHRGKSMFGFNSDGEMYPDSKEVVKRIFELRDKGYSYRLISQDEGVYHPGGRKISISTIAVIVNNREKYEEAMYGGKEN